MQKVIGACRAEKGMTVVLEAGSALSYDQAADITSEIVTRLDQEKVDFGPRPSLEPAPAPEEDASADNAADAASAGEKPGASRNRSGGHSRKGPCNLRIRSCSRRSDWPGRASLFCLMTRPPPVSGGGLVMSVLLLKISAG